MTQPETTNPNSTQPTKPINSTETPSKKINKKTILIAVAVILIILIALSVVFSKKLISGLKPTKDAVNPQTTLNQSKNQNPNQPQPDPRQMDEDEKYLEDLITSRPDADRYEELLR